MLFIHRTLPLRRVALSLGLASLIIAGSGLPALAASTDVSQSVTGGTLSASLATPSFAAVSYAHTAQNSDATATLSVSDTSGTGAGWNVTVLASELSYAGANNGTAIPATAVSVESIGAITATAGDPVDPTNGPVAGTPGALDSARKVLSANATYGEGDYTADLGLRIVIPAQARAGTYSGTLTITAAAGPGV